MIVLGLFSGCETDIDLTAPYKSTPVIYGVLDNAAEIQFFRINRTFLGDGNAYDYAAIADSSEYDPEDVHVLLKKYVGNELVNTITLNDTIISSRKPGAFYNEDIRFYYTAEPLLEGNEGINPTILSSIRYDLEATLEGKLYTASTPMVNIRAVDITYPFYNEDTPTAMTFTVNENYSQQNIRFRSGVNGKRYEVLLRFYADLVLDNGDILHDQFYSYKIGETSTASISGGSEISMRFSSGSIYETTANWASQIPDLHKVKIKRLEFQFTGGSEVMDIYLNLNEPSSSIATINPEYSNIEGAIGIFASKSTFTMDAYLQNPSVGHFNVDQYNDSETCYCSAWSSPGGEFTCSGNDLACP